MSTGPYQLAGGIPARRRIEVVTPEGVPVGLERAPLGSRILAFVVDHVLQGLLILGIWLALGSGGELGETLAILGSFFVHQFWFIWFEHRWRGQSPGKRMLGLRVVDAGGGSLGTDAILVRNLTREVETTLPLMVLVSPGVLWPGAPPGLALLGLLWLLVAMSWPLFDRRRQRPGDLLAGTLVVRRPRVELQPDVAGSRERVAQYHFTRRQLGVYGIYELQVLEELLRHRAGNRDPATTERVVELICRKLGWEGDTVDTTVFLEDFYRALRGHLERESALGRRRESQHDPPGDHAKTSP